jgi:hypothetical protein
MTATDPTPQPGEFHEPDERPDDVAAAFDRGERGVTAPPPPTVQASGVTVDEPTGERTHTSGPLADADMTEAEFDAAHAAGEPVTVAGIRPPWWRVTTDPTPQPVTHASGPGQGMPLVAGRCPACRGSSLFLGVGGHATCARLDCPDPSAADDLLHGGPADPVVVLEGALCRRVWAAALRWEAGQLREVADRHERAGRAGEADASRDYASVLEIDAHRIETGELTPWADQPEPPAAPAQPAGDAPAAAGPTAELEHAKADRQDLWDTRDKRNHRWMEAAERLTDELAEVRAELAVVTADREALFRTHEWAATEHERELATARRDAAADALRTAHDIALAGDGTISARSLAEAEAEIRDGTRPVPGSPEPAPAGGEEPRDA